MQRHQVAPYSHSLGFAQLISSSCFGPTECELDVRGNIGVFTPCSLCIEFCNATDMLGTSL